MMEFVVCIDAVSERSKATRWRRLLLGKRSEAQSGDDWDEVMEVVRALRGPHARVLVIDRRNGGVYADAHLEKMTKEAA
jgi:hypothetical protein